MTLAPSLRPLATALAAALALAATPARAQAGEEDPKQFVAFSEDFEAVCVEREGVMIQIYNKHPSRPLRVWLERWHMGAFTGDRSKSDLKPGAEPEKLGCSRTLTGKQEWRVVRAQFIDAQ
ncbi:MAG TPA: hypothetical protein PLX20_07895 [Rhodocyclaceae bacterium]|nr:hypothetical protein [Rhodocyclaceae bacterium]HMV53534.1 hypothetical protein [Rhodocyclaceae bacterium]HMZ83660.1 hypothetical protein [Rhodocyclaceae bacterium]HNA04671.1 hypothetical protein [Rhodocyclaceae bacterium]HNB80155.1 hypothetical protein [Rhodocyclaceae bacterium]